MKQNPTTETPEQIRHTLSKTQQETVHALIEQSRDAESKLRFFLGFICRDANLPAVQNGYTLSQDGTELVGKLPDPAPTQKD